MAIQIVKEEYIFVDEAGLVRRVSDDKTRSPDDYMAVVLVLVFLPKEKQIVLFNRGTGASDMHDHWALTAGKMNATDFAQPLAEVTGKKLSLESVKNAAVREFMEELSISPEMDDLEKVIDFNIPEKGLYFTMLAWPIDESRFADFSPDGMEVDKIRRFSLGEFRANQHLGDAIVYRKESIVSFLNQKFLS
jgi:8-oxo-dGTP pyrophosphatase MutT (NUDIX family)